MDHDEEGSVDFVEFAMALYPELDEARIPHISRWHIHHGSSWGRFSFDALPHTHTDAVLISATSLLWLLRRPLSLHYALRTVTLQRLCDGHYAVIA